MRYMMLFCGHESDGPAFAALSKEEQEAAEQAVYDWIGRYAGKLGEHSRLAPVSEAKTLRPNGAGKLIVTDGPFVESGEIVGGFGIVDVESIDEAVEMAKSWPAGPVEIRRLT